MKVWFRPLDFLGAAHRGATGALIVLGGFLQAEAALGGHVGQ